MKEPMEERAPRKKKGAGRKTLAVAALGAVLGFYVALRLDEETRSKLKKGLFELREMPFRLFV